MLVFYEGYPRAVGRECVAFQAQTAELSFCLAHAKRRRSRSFTGLACAMLRLRSVQDGVSWGWNASQEFDKLLMGTQNKFRFTIAYDYDTITY